MLAICPEGAYVAADFSQVEPMNKLQDFLDGIAQDDMPPLTFEQEQEVERRMAEHDKDPSRASSWEEVRARIRSRFA
jgi:putative addiction module component (TIGR02574 family)